MLLDYLTGQQQAEFTVIIKITSNRTNFNLSTELQNTYGWNGTSSLNTIVIIEPGVLVYSTTSANVAYNVPADLEGIGNHVLINKGLIIGSKGVGGTNGGSGTNGGPALTCSATYVIDNSEGVISGGGGGGGGGQTMSGGEQDFELGCEEPSACTGGPGGNGYGDNNISPTGGGSAVGGGGSDCSRCASGGSGGNAGQNGSAGSAIGHLCSCDLIIAGPGSGGAAGNAVTGNSNIIWIATGNRQGPIV